MSSRLPPSIRRRKGDLPLRLTVTLKRKKALIAPNIARGEGYLSTSLAAGHPGRRRPRRRRLRRRTQPSRWEKGGEREGDPDDLTQIRPLRVHCPSLWASSAILRRPFDPRRNEGRRGESFWREKEGREGKFRLENRCGSAQASRMRRVSRVPPHFASLATGGREKRAASA